MHPIVILVPAAALIFGPRLIGGVQVSSWLRTPFSCFSRRRKWTAVLWPKPLDPLCTMTQTSPVSFCSATGLWLDLTPGHLAGWFGPLVEESAKAIGLNWPVP